MLYFLTSPAKMMKVPAAKDFARHTRPQFLPESEKLAAVLREMSARDIAEMMEISGKLADENWQRYQEWTSSPTKTQRAAALYAFTGEVYRGLQADQLSEEAIQYLKKHYRILSGLYGLLRPTDEIMLYRLEMGRKVKTDTSEDLYQYWQAKITTALNEFAGPRDTIINLSSKEYSKAVDWKKLKAKAITVDFLQASGNNLRQVVLYTKHARGLMIRYCAENQIKKVEDVKNFDLEGYCFLEEKSTPQNFVFVREDPKALPVF